MIKHFYFGMFDVLITGRLNKKPDTSYLSQLVEFAKDEKIQLYLMTGLDASVSEEIVTENNLNAYFPSKNIICISDSYFKYLSEMDKELKTQEKEKCQCYSDEYFKVYYFNNQFNLPKQKALFVGHDVWADAYYLHKFSQVNSVLLRCTLSHNHLSAIPAIKNLNIIDPTIECIKDYLLNEKQFDYSALCSYADKFLYNEMFGSSLANTKKNTSLNM